MKTIITILLALLSFTCFAYTDCMGPKDVSFWVKLPTQSLAVVSCYAFALFLLCLPIRYFQMKNRIKWPILESYLILLYGIWLWTDAQYHWTDRVSESWTFYESFSFFIVYFFCIYRERLIPFFTKMTKSRVMLFLIFVVFAIAFYKSFFGNGRVDCGDEYLQIYPVSNFSGVFVWITLAWLIFNRSWRVFVASLPFSYLFFYVGGVLENLLRTSYHSIWSIFMEIIYGEFGLGDFKYIVAFATIFILQVFAHYVQRRIER